MAKRGHGKKANKIKDPYAIQRERDRGKIFNKKPQDPNDEFVPRKVQELMKLANGSSNGKRLRKKKQLKNGPITSRAFVETQAPVKGMTRPLKPIPLFEQGPNESDCKFLKRVEKMTKERVQQSKFEDKYNVDIIPDPVTGERKMISREDKNGRKKKKKKVDEHGEEIPKKINRKKLMRQKRREKLAEKQDDFAHLTDSVGFGEIAQRPPEIRAAPKSVPADVRQTKPGRKSLLLKELYTAAQTGARTSVAPKSPHQKARLEQERLRVVDAYRHIKQQRIARSAAAAAGR